MSSAEFTETETNRAASQFVVSAECANYGRRLKVPDEHAEPVETAIPFISRFISKPSPSINEMKDLKYAANVFHGFH